jgi:predicted helicase
MPLKKYLAEIEKTHQSGIAREHAYRGILQNLLHEILPEITATNEPKRIACGSPDYVLCKKNIPIGYIEAKDLDVNLDDKKHQEQLNRYLQALPNFIFTNYLEFYFYQKAELKVKIKIAEIAENKILPKAENFAEFISLIKNFSTQISQTINSPKDLAEMMASKARLLCDVIEKSINSDEENSENSSLKEQMESFKLVLIKGIKAKEFADIYAQTIAYGMFAARLHDKVLNTFSRQEAASLIPKTNPFLRKLFQYVAGYDLDERLVWIVDDLADIFRACDLSALLKNFSKEKQDPIIHFYETFLSKYDPNLRKSRGVWYTPESVVSFIVHGVDQILQNDFGLVNGLANSSKISKKINTGLVKKSGKEILEEKSFHRVQILDPAVGTGTFLGEVVRQIHQKFASQQGLWQQYVDEHLIARLNGFEILMASYAMAHLKLDLLLSETGFKGDSSNQRFKIFLTNSLEEASEDENLPLLAFMRELTQEGLEASRVKNEMPVMVILGNPPYSGESQNKGAWIMNLMDSYKKEPASKQKLQERNPKWLNDDYVKFIRLSQHFIEKNGEGVIAFINPHGFLDNPTFRGMRYSLLSTFDKIYTIDLHGNSKKKETAPDGSKDENVFDIQQGVSINFFVKTKGKVELTQNVSFKAEGDAKIPLTPTLSLKGRGSKPELAFTPSTLAGEGCPPLTPSPLAGKGCFPLTPSPLAGEGFREGSKNKRLAQVFHFDLFGKRQLKYNFLAEKSLKEIEFKKLENVAPNYFFSPKDFSLQSQYDCGFAVNEIFLKNTTGIQTGNDEILLGDSYENLKRNLEKNFSVEISKKNIQKICYRPFDEKFFYSIESAAKNPNKEIPIPKSYRSRNEVMQHFLNEENLGLIFSRQARNSSVEIGWNNIFITNKKSELALFRSANAGANISPLYLYSTSQNPNCDDFLEANKIIKKPNLNAEIIAKISEDLGLKFVAEFKNLPAGRFLEEFTPESILDYIYAILHCPNFRTKYQEFLKIDFPKIPYPKNKESFFKFVSLGEKLRKIHLLEEGLEINSNFSKSGSNKIEKIKFEDKKIYINSEQFFENVKKETWEFLIGGYQPLQKYLKDRKDKTLNFDEILHYQKIIAALDATQKLMQEINQIQKF